MNPLYLFYLSFFQADEFLCYDVVCRKKETSRKAVVRNRIKRQFMRIADPIMRKEAHPGYRYIFFPSFHVENATAQELADDISRNISIIHSFPSHVKEREEIDLSHQVELADEWMYCFGECTNLHEVSDCDRDMSDTESLLQLLKSYRKGFRDTFSSLD